MKTTIDKISSKKPKHIKRLILKRMKNNQHLKTMTSDNDQAFSLHQEIADILNIKTFLPDLTPLRIKEVLKTEMV